jgi:hypothetical protein
VRSPQRIPILTSDTDALQFCWKPMTLHWISAEDSGHYNEPRARVGEIEILWQYGS